uniref:Uncharacterized protein n=1 Tax=Phlebotomus papatasi TaxID=29031 RepID=A0A1B0D048_PHLPP
MSCEPYAVYLEDINIAKGTVDITINGQTYVASGSILNPICAVTGSQYLTKTGWSELRNTVDTDVPFRLFRDEGRTFLQWVGEAELRYRMQGRLILVHLLCRDMTPPNTAFSASNGSSSGSSSSGGVASVDDDLLPNQNIFTPCVAFRVVGTPIRHVNNVTEVSFQAESSTVSNAEGLSTREYVVIGLCSLLLGLIYVASVFLYLHMKKRKAQSPSGSVNHTMKNNDLTFPPNDQVTYGPGFQRNGGSSAYGSKTYSPRNQGNNMRNVTGGSLVGEEMGIIKSNPLLKHFPNLSDNSGFISDQSNSNSEFDDDHPQIDMAKTQVTVHSEKNSPKPQCNDSQVESSAGNQEERIPEENVSIVDDMTAEDKLENMKAIVNGTIRRKLYFNPAYFEPDLLVSPPPAALEFLHKIREVITIAKFKMSTKKFQPSLEALPEELQNGSEIYYGRSVPASSKMGSVVGGTRSDTSKKKPTCSGCPGCETSSISSAKKLLHQQVPSTPDDGNCKNCGDKRNSIRKWLEGVSSGVNEDSCISDTEKKDSDTGEKENKTTELVKKNLKHFGSDSSSSSDSDTIKANSIKSSKKKAPPIPTNPPRIINRPTKINPTSPSNEFGKTQLFNKIAKSEIYNNPQFMQSSPELPPRNPHAPHQFARGHRKQHIDVQDQYSSSTSSLNVQVRKQEMLRNMPDMVYEALNKDYKNRAQTIESPFGTLKLPTPDYTDEDYQTHVFRKSSDSPGVPTPDYNSLSRIRTKNFLLGSPIYARKSPHYLIVDYETDSLERAPCKNRKIISSPSSSNSSSDSQPSPSLSAALPLEEEVEMRNAVYDKVEGFRKDAIGDIIRNKKKTDYSLVSEVYVGSNAFSSRGRQSSKIKYNVPYAGSMTIELDPSPDEYDLSTDSDQFEPDTLDRKPKKCRELPSDNIKAWDNHLIKSTEFLNNTDNNINYSSLENMTSLPDLNYMQQHQKQLVLRTTGSFKSDSLSQVSDLGVKMHGPKTFGSLREIYEAKSQKNLHRPPLTNIDFMEKGKLLTLEERHSKRQRSMTENTLNRKNKSLPPDVIPYSSHYDHPRPPVAVSPTETPSKNLTVWNTEEFSRTADQSQDETFEHDTDTYETRSTNSETTEFTGVSEVLANSEFEHDRRILANNLEYPTMKEYTTINKLSRFYDNNDYITENNGCYINKMEGKPVDILDTYMTIEEVENKKINDTEKFDEDKKQSEIDRIEVISTKSLSNSIKTNSSKQSTLKSTKFTENLVNLKGHSNLQAPKIFRVEINPESDAMKLAMGMRDRAKKSKDIKNAWKRFVSLATSKLRVSSPTKPDIKFNFIDSLEDGTDRDEGISSLIDENMNENKSAVEHPTQISPTRSGQKPEPDSGYMSADSNESKVCNKKYYDRFSFRTIEDKINEASYIDIVECSEPETDHQYSVMQCDSNKITLEITDNTETDLSIVKIEENEDDTDHYSSGLSTSEEDSDDDGDELCESGAESVETHSK